MLLQPIVENAVKHGLEPTVTGGEITIAAKRNGPLLMLIVTDTGRGFRETAPRNATGIGLANLRDRLAALFDDSAALTIEDAPPHGTRVLVSIPLATAAGAATGVASAPAFQP